MHTARGGATATLLKDGKVLIAGGGSVATFLNESAYASAELYDPSTGKFTKTGSMAAARAKATAIRLSDGRVLIAGGEGCPGSAHCANAGNGANPAIADLVSAEIYDPTTGKFTRTGSMTGVTQVAEDALLPDGKVLIVGQDNSSAQLYDPATGKFVHAGKVADREAPITATLLPNGKVLVTGSSSDGLDTVAQLYDEASGKLTTISLTACDRDRPETATLLQDGRVLLFEGGGYLEIYDPATGACADAFAISPAGRGNPTATLMSDGRVLFAGGQLVNPLSPAIQSADTAWLYDPTGQPARTGTMHLARQDLTATLLPDGSVLIAGGEDSNQKPLASAELFKP
jgi:WD40 repeat protein